MLDTGKQAAQSTCSSTGKAANSFGVKRAFLEEVTFALEG